ncbi:hypothetical protein QBC38DRAFT_468676 [Podospora fimiseda]|uniref:Uncharacterized protein n=1 Tax=Podospora fimiseda TaxID=252190 RepID=A0AAN7H0D6_9PEZI|nr:hypothetical protein QBC38DRAFT_468676 [Podospora fimiseda]
MGRKMYCWKEECKMFISGWNQRTCSGTCPKCGERTCRLCGGRAHMFGLLGVVGRGAGRKMRVDSRRMRRGDGRGMGLCPGVDR